VDEDDELSLITTTAATHVQAVVRGHYVRYVLRSDEPESELGCLPPSSISRCPAISGHHGQYRPAIVTRGACIRRRRRRRPSPGHAQGTLFTDRSIGPSRSFTGSAGGL
jgi:hypothetical protein